MKVIRIKLDYLSGPIWQELFDNVTGKSLTGIELVDNDDVIKSLDSEIQGLYSSYYHFGCDGEPYFFDTEQEKADKEKMLALLKNLKSRLDELNDGTFAVIDEETERVRGL